MLEITVISPEAAFPNELDWLAKLFDAGLSRYHLRKPEMTDGELSEFIGKIPEKWLERIVPHQAYPLVEVFRLGGWHFKDDAQQLLWADAWKESRRDGQTMSRSIHCLDDLNENLSDWDFVFLSPVFQSISKCDHGPGWKESQLAAALHYGREAYGTRVYALGGVDASRIRQCHGLGFDGVALLGSIWQSRHPLESFLKVQGALEHLN